MQTAVRALKRAYPDLVVITDVCLCEYTSHGHCGVVEDGEVATTRRSSCWRAPRCRTRAPGADVVAPSDMMDGRVGAIREALDEAGFDDDRDPVLRGEVRLGVLRPVPRGGRLGAAVRRPARRTRWTRPTSDEALREVALDLEEGADIVMVKPALAYLDVIRRVKDDLRRARSRPTTSAASTRCSMAAAERGWIDRERDDPRDADRRSSARARDIILTYHAREAARLLRR